MWTDTDFKKLTVRECAERLWQVCVITEVSNKNRLDSLNQTTLTLENEIKEVKSTVLQLEDNLRSVLDDLISNQSSLHDEKRNQLEADFLGLKEDTVAKLKNLSDTQQQKITSFETDLIKMVNKTNGMIKERQTFLEKQVKQMEETMSIYNDTFQVVLDQSAKDIIDTILRTNITIDKKSTQIDNKVTQMERSFRDRFNQLTKVMNESLARELSRVVNYAEESRKGLELRQVSFQSLTSTQQQMMQTMNRTTRNIVYAMLSCIFVISLVIGIKSFWGSSFLDRLKIHHFNEDVNNRTNTFSTSSSPTTTKSESLRSLTSSV